MSRGPHGGHVEVVGQLHVRGPGDARGPALLQHDALLGHAGHRPGAHLERPVQITCQGAPQSLQPTLHPSPVGLLLDSGVHRPPEPIGYQVNDLGLLLTGGGELLHPVDESRSDLHRELEGDDQRFEPGHQEARPADGQDRLLGVRPRTLGLAVDVEPPVESRLHRRGQAVAVGEQETLFPAVRVPRTQGRHDFLEVEGNEQGATLAVVEVEDLPPQREPCLGHAELVAIRDQRRVVCTSTEQAGVLKLGFHSVLQHHYAWGVLP